MKLAVKITVSFGLLGLIFWLLDWQTMGDALARYEMSTWLIVLAGLLTVHAVGILKWRMILAVGRAKLTVREAARCYFAGLFANLCLPSIVGGDALRAVLATKACRRGEAVVLGGIADRVLDLAALGLLAAVGGVLTRSAYPDWLGRVVMLAVALGVLGVAVVAVLIFVVPMGTWPPKVQRLLKRSLVALRRILRRPGVAGLAFVLCLGMQGSLVLLMVLVGRGAGIDSVPLATWFLAWPLAKVAGLLPVSLAGLGVRDGTLAALLTPAGVPYGQGFMASLIWQTELVGLGLVGGGVWLLLRPRNEASRTVRDAGTSVPAVLGSDENV